ncbi:Metallo-dependent phosphatase-like protein [Corynascus novoguineensis]|uniref:Serine/threonine-protein phosphatase n=1 Tax=Corynascus novoguineensis TaxID=1126955 RepID=A0AAN7HI98_9PEZI|nr:Metallo-dependent phosphatase-like protein [Corynascus novoguineensis]
MDDGRKPCLWSRVITRAAEIATDQLDIEIRPNITDGDIDILVTKILEGLGEKSETREARRRDFIFEAGRGTSLLKEFIEVVEAKHRELPNVLTMAVTAGEEWNLRAILRKNGLPSPQTMYIFNGDIVDRGPASVECVLIIFALKYRFPDYIFINRGNHESWPINNENGFRREARTRLGLEIYDAFSRCFLALPLGIILEVPSVSSGIAHGDGESHRTARRLLCLHGGIPVGDDGTHVNLAMMQNVERIAEPKADTSLLTQVLWNDPSPTTDNDTSKRGCWGLQFGSKTTEQFLRVNDLDGVIRSHEDIVSEFEVAHANCLTVFSAHTHRPRYLDISPSGDFVWTLRPDIDWDHPDQYTWFGYGRDDQSAA